MANTVSRVTAVAHRGDPYLARENTPCPRSAPPSNADAVEIDVRVTRDGVPVLLHDATLERLWGQRPARGPDRARGAEGADRRRGAHAPRGAALAAGAHRVMVDLPGSTDASVKKIVGTVRECGAGERAYYCANSDAMLRVRAADPSAEIALTWTTLAPPRPELLAAVKPRWLNYRFGLISRELTDRAHRDGLLVSAWTADTKRTMRKLIERGVDSITTNRIDTLHRLVANSPGRGGS